MDEELERYAAEGVPDDLVSWSNDQLRTARAESESAEGAVSYIRRVLQGRLDIVRAELERRHDAGHEAVGGLLERLPDLLAGDHVPTDPSHARATSVDIPARAEALIERIDAELGETTLARLADRDDAEMARLIAVLEGYEVQLSTARRALFARIDALRDELAARYTDGRAVVADLLR